MTTITANNVLTSRNRVGGLPLHTLLLRYPRCIHSEFLTHKALSKNAASSRAIPVDKLIRDVEENPFVPLVWSRNQKGMQGIDDFSPEEVEVFRKEWLEDRDYAVKSARRRAAQGLHKQVVNRHLEPFAHITVLASGTADGWNNLLWLRDHHAAEPHFQNLAKEIGRSLDDGLKNVQVLEPGQWHLPFITDDERRDAYNGPSQTLSIESLKMLSVARCASTSYKTVDGFDMTMDRAKSIYDGLLSMDRVHASPFEHVAQANFLIAGRVPQPSKGQNNLSGNFAPGWTQLRKTLPGENHTTR